MNNDRITLAHGNGGRLTHELIRTLLLPQFGNPPANTLADAALLSASGDLAFTTDSFVVKPYFFPGGDIGALAVTGSANDLAVMGARPLFLSCALIIEEGFPLSDLRHIIQSMSEQAGRSGIQVVTGDTKVVESGAADGIFINTSGIGVIGENRPGGPDSIRPGDAILVSGPIGDHGMAIYARREGIELDTNLISDCAPIYPLVRGALSVGNGIRVMRDPTRGGVGAVLNEFVEDRPFGIRIREQAIPVRPQVRGICELLGFDPLNSACEGRVVIIAAGGRADEILGVLRSQEGGGQAAVIGEVIAEYPGRVIMETLVGGERIVDLAAGELLPRIC